MYFHIYSSSQTLSMISIASMKCNLLPMNRNVLSTITLKSLVILMIVGLSSCAELPLNILQQSPDDIQAKAEQSFLNGDFQDALLEYEQIHETALSSDDRNSALYGMACTQLILAQNDDQFVEAITKLQRWNANKGTGNFRENRNLLILALKQQSERIKENKQNSAAQDKKQKSIIYSQKKKISQMAATLKTLKSQLDELESIDETYQEKRKP